jgi:hypothetical protein
MDLVTLTGARAGVTLTVPPYLGTGMADGGGDLLFEGVGGVYRGGRDGIRRLTTGAFVAAGPTGVVTVDCDAKAVCSTVLRGRDGTRSTVPTAPPVQRGPGAGLISPDGKAMLLSSFGDAGSVSATLVDLADGANHTLPLSLPPSGAEGTIVWSPDSRWLFAVDIVWEVKVIDVRTRVVGDLVPGLPSVRQLAVRT